MLVPRRSLTLSGVIVAVVLLAACARSVRPAPSAEVPAGTPTPAPSSRNITTNDSIEQLTSGGVTRQYRLHLSTPYQAGQPTPLVINLHGYNSDAAQQEQVSQMSAKADRAEFIVVYPEGLGDPQSWKFGGRPEGQADVAFIRDLIQHLESQFSIDPKRIYVTLCWGLGPAASRFMLIEHSAKAPSGPAKC